MMLGMMLHSGKDAYNICKAMGSTPNTMKKREKKAPDVMGSQMGSLRKTVGTHIILQLGILTST